MREPLAGVGNEEVVAWMTQAEAWKQKAVKAEAELTRYRAVVDAAKRAVLHSDRLSDASGAEGVAVYSQDWKPLIAALDALRHTEEG